MDELPPPPLQILAKPFCPFSSTWQRCVTIRAPDIPMGWPRLTAPPWIFTCTEEKSILSRYYRQYRIIRWGGTKIYSSPPYSPNCLSNLVIWGVNLLPVRIEFGPPRGFFNFLSFLEIFTVEGLSIALLTKSQKSGKNRGPRRNVGLLAKSTARRINRSLK